MEDEELDLEQPKDPFGIGTGAVRPRSYSEVVGDNTFLDFEVEHVHPDTSKITTATPQSYDGNNAVLRQGKPNLTAWDYFAAMSVGSMAEEGIVKAQMQDEARMRRDQAPVWQMENYRPDEMEVAKVADKYELPETFFKGLAQATSPDDLERRGRQFSRKVMREEQMSLEASNPLGLVKQIAIGMFDPAYLAAVGGLTVALKGWQVNSALGAALKGATIEGAAAVGVEGAQFAWDPTQTPEKAATTVLLSAALGAGFEAAGHGISTGVLQRLDRQLAQKVEALKAVEARRQELIDSGLYVDDGDGNLLEAIVSPEEVTLGEPGEIPQGPSVGAAANPDATPVFRSSEGYEPNPAAPEKAGFGRFGSPMDFLARSDSPETRRVASNLVWDPASGRAQGVDAVGATRRIFEAGSRFLRDARMAARDWARANGKAGRSLLNPFGQPNTETLQEFFKLVAQVHKGVRESTDPHVLRAVAAYREGYKDALLYLKNSSYNGPGSESLQGLSHEDFFDIPEVDDYVMTRFSAPGWRNTLGRLGIDRVAAKMTGPIYRANLAQLMERAEKIVAAAEAADSPSPAAAADAPPVPKSPDAPAVAEGQAQEATTGAADAAATPDPGDSTGLRLEGMSAAIVDNFYSGWWDQLSGASKSNAFKSEPLWDKTVDLYKEGRITSKEDLKAFLNSQGSPPKSPPRKTPKGQFSEEEMFGGKMPKLQSPVARDFYAVVLKEDKDLEEFLRLVTNHEEVDPKELRAGIKELYEAEGIEKAIPKMPDARANALRALFKRMRTAAAQRIKKAQKDLPPMAEAPAASPSKPAQEPPSGLAAAEDSLAWTEHDNAVSDYHWVEGSVERRVEALQELPTDSKQRSNVFRQARLAVQAAAGPLRKAIKARGEPTGYLKEIGNKLDRFFLVMDDVERFTAKTAQDEAANAADTLRSLWNDIRHAANELSVERGFDTPHRAEEFMAFDPEAYTLYDAEGGPVEADKGTLVRVGLPAVYRTLEDGKRVVFKRGTAEPLEAADFPADPTGMRAVYREKGASAVAEILSGMEAKDIREFLRAAKIDGAPTQGTVKQLRQWVVKQIADTEPKAVPPRPAPTREKPRVKSVMGDTDAFSARRRTDTPPPPKPKPKGKTPKEQAEAFIKWREANKKAKAEADAKASAAAAAPSDAPAPRAVDPAVRRQAVEAKALELAEKIASKYVRVVQRIMDPATKMVDVHMPVTREFREAAKDIARQEFAGDAFFADNVEEAIDMIMDLVAPVRQSAKDSNRARSRLKMDLKAGRDDDILGIYDWNAEALYTTYRRQTAGLAGLLKAGYTSSRQLDQEINALRTEGLEFPDEGTRMRRAKEADTLDLLKGAILGTPPPWVKPGDEDWMFLTTLMRRYNFTRSMNNTGFLSFSEVMGSLVQMGPMRFLTSLPAYRKYISQVRKGDPQAIESAMWVGDALMGHGSSQVRARAVGFVDRQEDPAVAAIMDRKSSKARDMLDRASRKASNLTARLSGMAPISEWLRTSIVGAEAQAWVKNARLGKMPYSLRRMTALGVDEGMWTRISTQLNKMRDITSPDTGQPRPFIDFSVWEDGEAANVFMNALDRNSRRLVLEGDPGHLPFGLDRPSLSLLTQFLRFPMNAWTKHTRFAMAVHDGRALAEMLAMSIGGAIGHVSRVAAIAYVAKDGEKSRQEYLDKMLSPVEVSKAVLYYSAHGSLLPNIYDTGLAAFVAGGGLEGPDGKTDADLHEMLSFGNTRASGNPADLFTGNPSYQWAFKQVPSTFKKVRQGPFTEGDMEAVARTFAPLGNHVAMLGAVNLLGDLLPPEEDEK